MDLSRRLFIRNGVATVTFGITAPSFLTAIAEAQGIRTRNLVVVYLGGGNDSLNTLISYRDGAYYSRRPSIAVPAGQVLQVGSDAAGQAMGLHPRLGGLLNIFNEGRLALVQRTGYANSSRSHFEASDIWGTANPQSSTGSGWLGRYLDVLPRPLDALAAWNTTAETPRALISGTSGVPAIPNASTYSLREPESRCRSIAGAHRRADDGEQSGERTSASGVREQHRARSDRDARSCCTGNVVYADGRVSETAASPMRCRPSRARSCAASVRACSGCRPAATTRMPARAAVAVATTPI